MAFKINTIGTKTPIVNRNCKTSDKHFRKLLKNSLRSIPTIVSTDHWTFECDVKAYDMYVGTDTNEHNTRFTKANNNGYLIYKYGI